MNIGATIQSAELLRDAQLHNAVLDHPTVSVALPFLCRANPSLAASKLIAHVAGRANFPGISVKDLIGAAAAAGIELRGARAEFSELAELSPPFLTFLHRGPGHHLELFRIERIGRLHCVIANDRFGALRMPLEELSRRWTGIVLLQGAAWSEHTASELESYRREMTLIDGLLSTNECAELVDYCEQACFKRSRVGARVGLERKEMVSARVRSSSSVALFDREHPLLKRLYQFCAESEGVPVDNVEMIQCVRYKRGQRFKAHYDGGIGLPRLTTYLMYLCDDFVGGETYFPLLDYAVQPKAGRCLRFASCDRDGRMSWPSLHGGLPVKSGVKYALNIWVGCPSRPS